MPSLLSEHQQFFDEITGQPLNAGYVYIGARNLAPQDNAITIYSDRDLSVPIANPQRTGTDGRTVNKIYVPGKYSIEVEDVNNVQKYINLDNGSTPTGEDSRIVVDSMEGLIALDTTIVTEASIKGFHASTNKGSGDFVYDSTQDRANHNGITIIDPTNTADLSTWDASAQTTWFAAGTGTGCWLRVYDSEINIQWAGSTGDGVDDDTKTIQAALDSGADLVFGDYTYKVTSTLTVSNSMRIDLQQSTINCATGIACFEVTASNVTIINGSLEGSDAGAYVASSDGIYIHGTVNGATTAPTRISDIRIENVKINNFGDYSIRAWYMEDVDVINCDVTNCGYMGIHGFSANRMRAYNCLVDTVAGETGSGELNAYGINFSNLTDSDAVRYPPSEDCSATLCEVKNIPNWHGIMTKGGQKCRFKYNTVTDCRRGIVLSFTNTSPKDCEVTHNTIANHLARSNTAATTTSNQQAEALWDIGEDSSNQAENNKFEHNTIFQHGAGIGSAGAVFLQNTKNGSVSHNTIMEPYLTGITVASDVDNYTISHNTIIDPKGPGTGGSPAMSSNVMRGIQFRDSNMDNITVINNSFVRRDGSLETYVGNIGILVANVSTKSIHFSLNSFTEMGTSNFNIGADVSGLSGDIEYNFTGTLTGCSTSPTGTIRSSVVGNLVTLHFPSINGTSNATTMTMTGIPAWLQPATDRFCLMVGQDNSVFDVVNCRVDSGANTLTFFYGAGNAAWTNSGTKGVGLSSISYYLN